MKVAVNKRSAYAPVRYEATRPWALRVGKAFLAAAKKGAGSRRKFVSEDLIPLVKTAMHACGVQEEGPGPAQAEVVNVQVFGSFFDGGKVIFELAPALTRTLELTDSGEMPCGSIPFPSSSFYLHFGTASTLASEGLSIEGAFVTKYEDRFVIDLANVGFGAPYYGRLPKGDLLISVPVLLSEPKKSVAQSMSDTIKDVLEKNAAYKEQLKEIRAQVEAQYGMPIEVPTSRDDLEEQEPLLQRALSLVTNTLFYLAAESDDLKEEWERSAPPEVLAQLQKTTVPGTLRTLENSLTKAGYSKIRYVGRRFERSAIAREIEAAHSSGRTLATHFRKGHIREQAYGPQHSLRKPILVAPVMVNAGKGDPSGRIYTVS